MAQLRCPRCQQTVDGTILSLCPACQGELVYDEAPDAEEAEGPDAPTHAVAEDEWQLDVELRQGRIELDMEDDAPSVPPLRARAPRRRQAPEPPRPTPPPPPPPIRAEGAPGQGWSPHPGAAMPPPPPPILGTEAHLDEPPDTGLPGLDAGGPPARMPGMDAEMPPVPGQAAAPIEPATPPPVEETDKAEDADGGEAKRDDKEAEELDPSYMPDWAVKEAPQLSAMDDETTGTYPYDPPPAAAPAPQQPVAWQLPSPAAPVEGGEELVGFTPAVPVAPAPGQFVGFTPVLAEPVEPFAPEEPEDEGPQIDVAEPVSQQEAPVLLAAAAGIARKPWEPSDEGIALCRRVLNSFPHNLQAMVVLADLLEREGRIKEAINTCEGFLRLRPGNRRIEGQLDRLREAQSLEAWNVPPMTAPTYDGTEQPASAWEPPPSATPTPAAEWQPPPVAAPPAPPDTSWAPPPGAAAPEVIAPVPQAPYPAVAPAPAPVAPPVQSPPVYVPTPQSTPPWTPAPDVPTAPSPLPPAPGEDEPEWTPSLDHESVGAGYSVWAIVALVGSFFCPCLPIIPAIVALVECNQKKLKGKELAIAAIILNVFVSIFGIYYVGLELRQMFTGFGEGMDELLDDDIYGEDEMEPVEPTEMLQPPGSMQPQRPYGPGRIAPRSPAGGVAVRGPVPYLPSRGPPWHRQRWALTM